MIDEKVRLYEDELQFIKKQRDMDLVDFEKYRAEY